MTRASQPSHVSALEPMKVLRKRYKTWLRVAYHSAQGYVVSLCREAADNRVSSALASQLRRFPPVRLFAPAPAANENEEASPVDLVLNDFMRLDREQQEKVARGLAQLWDAFIHVYGGLSAFQTSSAIEQKAYMERLDAVARRMEVARGSDAAFHYVTVELMRHYMAFLHVQSRSAKAVILASMVASLIDQGQRMRAETA